MYNSRNELTGASQISHHWYEIWGTDAEEDWKFVN